jgi:integrase
MEFACAVVQPDGQITMTWPEGHRSYKQTGRRSCTLRWLRGGLKPFVRDFGERRLDSFTRQEALTWALPRGRHVHQSVRQFFNHAVDRDLIARNVFSRLGAVKRIRRIDRPGFQIVTDEQYQRLQRCARASRTDHYGLILQGAILAIGEAALRPGEIFALRHDDIDFAAGVLHVRRQVDLHTGVVQWPKDDAAREVVMSPALRSHLKIMPKLSEEILLPAPRGGYMRRSSWSAHWHSIRASASMPDLEFYELRHRALQWMIDPANDGGLGLDIQTTAKMAGHSDGGYLVCSTYTKLAQDRARTRARSAMNAYQQHTKAHPHMRKTAPSRSRDNASSN